MRAPNSAASAVDSPIVETDIPARLDRLPWGRFHTLVVVALGITWILDGLEVTLAGTVAGALKQSPVLQFSNADVGLAGSAYLAGAVLGALFFGWLTDRLGRKKLFFITLTVYLLATAATAFSWNLWSFLLFRFITGAGIGGEYAAINSTIQELIPARVRGWTDLVINGSFWIGAALGAVGAIVLLDPARDRSGARLARGVSHRRGAGGHRVLHAAVAAGKPALADDAWARRRGRKGRRRDRGAAARRRPRDPRRAAREGAAAHAHAHAARRRRAHADPPASRPHAGRARADGRAGVLLQRDLLHLRAGADHVLRHPEPACRLVHPAVRGRQRARAAAARAAVRHDRAAADDRVHLSDVGTAAGADRLAVRARHAHARASRRWPGA